MRHFSDKRQQWLDFYVWRIFVRSSWAPAIREGCPARAGCSQDGRDRHSSRGQWGADTPDTVTAATEQRLELTELLERFLARNRQWWMKLDLIWLSLVCPHLRLCFLLPLAPNLPFSSSELCLVHLHVPAGATLSAQGYCLSDFCLSFKTQLEHCCVLWEASPDLPLPPGAY